ncbi:AF4/FMR2 family member lilli [Drosophila guanche]|uniref:ALMS motif domain-containing protein n=1 Tax=Drosophila guanche TaxID=7266 RepID=A0A3B0JWE9_DROGU|nr:AF4/FMR2 family member lilli [Drosophila guanche]SPP77686.1 Hypothetical predicted protein [Drosophila guanche]
MPGHQCASAHQRKHTDEKRLLASRVPPKAREYLSELAVDRELERFMALSSTNSSGTSRSNTSMYTAPLHCTPRSVAAPSKPARGRTSAAAGQQQEAAAVASVPKETQSEEEIIKVTPIVATDCVVSASVEDLRTPTKPAGSQAPDRTPEKKTKNTQTPESSAIKSHKRLEWDPAADVGYYKRAVSTSNLSTLERSILEECWRQPQQRSETHLDRLQLEQGSSLEPLPLAQPPPLASSTFVHRSERRNTRSRGSSSNQSNRSSSRRELTSPTGGSSLASSFDYHHSSLPHQKQQQQLAKEKEKERQYTAAQLEKVLASRRQPKARENKENCQPAPDRGSSSASSSNAAGTEAEAAAVTKGDLDLGVDLLCSLVQSHSLSHSQKRVLIRNIAKRISCIEFGDTLRSRQSPSKSKAAAQLQDMATNTTASVARPVPAPRTRILMATNSGSSTASSSKEMVTARSNPRASKAASEATETEQRPPSAEVVIASAAAATAPAAMQLVSQEWLNPMTQSEIEYEERSRSRSCSSSNDSERRLALRSIELEIKRLQMMYKIVHRKSYGQAVAVVHRSPTNAIEYNPLISVEAPQQEVPPPLHTQQGQEQYLVAVERASDELPAAADVQAIPTPTPPPAPPPPPPPPRGRSQREKMATPNSSNSDGGRSESVCSFVQQRQRQFMEHYQNQQQQQLQQLQQHQQQQKEQQQLQRVVPRMQLQQEPQQEPQSMASQHHIEMSPGDGVYYTAVADGATTTTTTTTASSSSISSMLCLSSEMSIPMAGGGVVSSSKTTTTTTTSTSTSTTHQYDEATTGSRGQRQRRDRNESQQPTQTQTQTQTQRRGRHGIAYIIQFVESEMQQTMSLQDHLQLARPKFCAKSKQRKAILNQMQMLRSERRRELEQLLGEDVTLETLDRRLQQLPPPVTSCVRVFSTKEMKALTSKRCQRLPEVVAAQNRVREEQRRRSNRLMRDVFNRRMQSRVSKGKISLNHSLTII